jgi:hypothetical protein
MTERKRRAQVALELPKQVPALLHAVEAIVQAMTGNPFFPSPTPSLATITAALADLRDAQVTTLTKTRATFPARDEKLVPLESLMKRLKAYVQGVADDDPDNAVAIIESAGMHVWVAGPGAKPPFRVKAGPRVGTVLLVVRAVAKEAGYEWQWSADGGESWSPAPPTLQAKTVLTGLPSGVMCLFRYRATPRSGTTEWSEPVAFRVP